MLALNIPETGIKGFMNGLFKTDTFDYFEVRNVIINAFVQFDINGLIGADYLTNEEKGDNVKKYISWSTLRPYAFSIIKGGKRPQYMKFIFSFPKNDLPQIFPEASALFLNILFEGGIVFMTTGVSEKTFSLSRNVGAAWDEYIKEFFVSNNIETVNTE